VLVISFPELSFSWLLVQNAESVFGDDAADGTRGKASLRDFLIRVDDKISRVNDLAPFFPVGTNFVCISWLLLSRSLWKTLLLLVRPFFFFLLGRPPRGL